MRDLSPEDSVNFYTTLISFALNSSMAALRAMAWLIGDPVLFGLA